jgi:endoglucanase
MRSLLSYFDTHQIGWIAWAWVVAGSPPSYPQLVQDYKGAPTNAMGQLVYEWLQSYAWSLTLLILTRSV